MKENLISFLRKEFIIFFSIIWVGLIFNDFLSVHFPGRYTFMAMIFMFLCLIAAVYIRPLQKYIFKVGTPVRSLKPHLDFLMLMTFLTCLFLWQITSFEPDHQKYPIPIEGLEVPHPSDKPPSLDESPLIKKESPEYLKI